MSRRLRRPVRFLLTACSAAFVGCGQPPPPAITAPTAPAGKVDPGPPTAFQKIPRKATK